MSKISTIAIAAATAVATTTLTNMVNYVELQASAPGSAQSGSINVSGTVIANRIRTGTNTIPGAKVLVNDPTGVGGVAVTSQGNAVTGASNVATGTVSGGLFTADSTTGRAVSADETATSGHTFGGLFVNRSSSGTGCYGQAAAASGTGIGVFGSAESSGGIGVYATNYGTGDVVQLAGPNGAVYVGRGQVKKTYAQGKTLGVLPIAFGNIWFSGQVYGGSGNFTTSYDSVNKIVYITIKGETVTRTDYCTIVTGMTGSWSALADAASGKVKIALVNNNTHSNDNGTFHFVVFKSN